MRVLLLIEESRERPSCGLPASENIFKISCCIQFPTEKGYERREIDNLLAIVPFDESKCASHHSKPRYRLAMRGGIDRSSWSYSCCVVKVILSHVLILYQDSGKYSKTHPNASLLVHNQYTLVTSTPEACQSDDRPRMSIVTRLVRRSYYRHTHLCRTIITGGLKDIRNAHSFCE